jgi:hypothetical protein
LIQRDNFFGACSKNRAPNPSEIYAFDSKQEFRRSAICSVPATIGIDWSILELFNKNGVTGLAQKRPSAMTNGASAMAWRFASIARRLGLMGCAISSRTQATFKM